MANQSATVSFQRLFESALLRYEKKTGVTLSKHPLALQFQNCNSVEDFDGLLQDKAKDVKERERITKSMKTIVSILTPLSSVAFPPGAVGGVRLKALVAASYPDLFHRRFHLRKPYRLVLVSYSLYVPFSGLQCRFPSDTQVDQSAKGEISNFDALVNALESIENFIGRLSVYTDKTLPSTVIGIVVKIMAELIFTLALVTKKLKERKRGEFVLADVLPYSA